MAFDTTATLEVAGLVLLRAVFVRIAQTFLRHTLQPSIRHVINASDSDADSDNDTLPTTSSSSTTYVPSPTSSRYPSLVSESLFYIAFSESCVLCVLVLFQSLFVENALWFSWNSSLGILVFLIVFISPFVQCLLFVLNSKNATFSTRAILVALGLYLVILAAFFWLGNIVSRVLGVNARSDDYDIFNALLRRICVPGIILVAGLSGSGAIHTAYDAYEWRKTGRGGATQEHIDMAEESLKNVRNQIQARQRDLANLEAERPQTNRFGFFSNFIPSGWGSSRQIKDIEAELSGLRSMEAQFLSDVDTYRRHRDVAEQSKTFYGKMWQLFGYAFSLYCAYRVIMSAANLIFRLSSGRKRSDIMTSILSMFASWMNIDIDVAKWVKIIGFALIGGIIVVNLNSVLYYVSRAFRATSTAASTSFLLLFLAQLVALYMVTSLISLPTDTDPDDSSNDKNSVLDTLPDFATFSRLFDAIFLLSALIWFTLRYIRRQVRLSEQPLGLSDPPISSSSSFTSTSRRLKGNMFS